jgi:hypothetical protein
MQPKNETRVSRLQYTEEITKITSDEQMVAKVACECQQIHKQEQIKRYDKRTALF